MRAIEGEWRRREEEVPAHGKDLSKRWKRPHGVLQRLESHHPRDQIWSAYVYQTVNKEQEERRGEKRREEEEEGSRPRSSLSLMVGSSRENHRGLLSFLLSSVSGSIAITSRYTLSPKEKERR